MVPLRNRGNLQPLDLEPQSHLPTLPLTVAFFIAEIPQCFP